MNMEWHWQNPGESIRVTVPAPFYWHTVKVLGMEEGTRLGSNRETVTVRMNRDHLCKFYEVVRAYATGEQYAYRLRRSARATWTHLLNHPQTRDMVVAMDRKEPTMGDGWWDENEDNNAPLDMSEPCAGCGERIKWNTHDGDWQDETGSAYCERHYDECTACQDGESHPHWTTT